MSQESKFGTFGGVFTPSILTILGVIMYMRLPYIIGEAGLYSTLGIIFIAHIISFATGLSVSSIATDKKVQAGGTYFMISRSLGLPIGGTLGLALFVGLSFSVSLYIIGFSESLLGFMGENASDKDAIRLVGTLALLGVTIITFISTSLAIKAQYLIMAAILLSLLSVFMGEHSLAPAAPLLHGHGSAIPLMELFGLFFPAVTGFEAGVSMSGDLKNPRRSIPSGTIMAIAVGFLVYVSLAVFLSYTVEASLLARDSEVLLKISWMPQLVIAGIWGATISSALGSILGAPRILQATAQDRIMPRIFAKGHGAGNEPRNALLLCFIIAELGILIGDLNAIARIVSVFFIATYGFLNISCAFEAWTSADFRPQFKTPVWVSLIGAVACVLVMILLDLGAMVLAGGMLFGVFFLLKRRELSLESGDAWSGVWASLVKSGLEHLRKEKLHRRNWRPNILLFSGGTEARPHLVELGEAIASRLGMLSDFELVPGDSPLVVRSSLNQHQQPADAQYFKHRYHCRDVYSAVEEISRVYGFTGVEPNTILMGWSTKPSRVEQFTRLMQAFKRADYNTCYLRYNTESNFGSRKTIDLWWSGKSRNLAFGISLIQYLTMAGLWKSARVRLLLVNYDYANAEKIYRQIDEIIDTYRIQLEVKVINNGLERLSTQELIVSESAKTDLTIIGIPDDAYQTLPGHVATINEMLKGLGTVLFINAASSFEEWEVAIRGEMAGQASLVGEEALTLPKLYPSPYFVIESDIQKIDARYGKIQELLYRKSFEGFFAHLLSAVMDLEALTKQMHLALKAANAYPESYRRKKAMNKVLGDFYSKSKKIIGKIQDEAIKTHAEDMEAGIAWYTKLIDDDVRLFPVHIRIEYPTSAFAIDWNDNLRTRVFKMRKQAIARLTGRAISQNIRYREVAQSYLRDQRQVFMVAFLKSFYFGSIEKLSLVRHSLCYIHEWLLQVQSSIERHEPVDELLEHFLQIQSSIQIIPEQLRQHNWHQMMRMQVEFRKNLQQMSNRLSEIHVNRNIRKKRMPGKQYEALRKANGSFSEVWYRNIGLFANKLLVEWTLNAVKSQVIHEARLLQEELFYEVQKHYLKELEKTLASVEKGLRAEGSGIIELHDLKPAETISMSDIFDRRRPSIDAIIKELPETIDISDDATETQKESRQIAPMQGISVPLSRIAEHFLEANFMAATQRAVRRLGGQCSKAVYSVKDQLSLTKFRLENLQAGEEGAQKNILEETLQLITNEIEALRQASEQTLEQSLQSIEDAFEPLEPHKIADSTRAFSLYLRDYQGKRMLSGFNKLLAEGQEAARKQVAKALYSRSKGVLLAKRLTDEKQLIGGNFGKILDFVEAFSPKERVLAALPYYYHSLFSGRSVIDDEFWVERPIEEGLFQKAYKRYEAGFKGGVLILGERNTGKTALSKYCIEHYCKQTKPIYLFPPTEGSAAAESLRLALQKATGLRGSAEEIVQTLPYGSLIVVNDLELWWDRHPDGLAVMTQLKALMENFASQCFFVANANPHAYRLLNQLLQLDQLFIQTIACTPFDANELHQLVMRRHQSSGLSLSLKQGKRLGIGDLGLATLFNQLFNCSAGNPGMALNLWLSNIEQVDGRSLKVNMPKNPQLAELKLLDMHLQVTLLQFVLHKRLTVERLAKVQQQPMEEARQTIASLLRSGILKEKQKDIYHINEYVEPFVVRSLKSLDML